MKMPKVPAPKKIGLTAYLLKQGGAGTLLTKKEYLARPEGPDGVSVMVRHVEHSFEAEGLAGHVFVKDPPNENTPDWVDFVSAGIESDFSPERLSNKSVSSLLVVSAGPRQFALAFGHGRHMLNHEYVEPRFGIKVCLNSIEPGKVASLDKQTFDANPRLTRTQAIRLSSVAEYGINAEQDLLKAVVGVTLPAFQAELGDVVAGMDALKLHIEADVDRLAHTLKSALERYESKDYLAPVNGRPGQFAWVDNLSIEPSKAIVDKLDELLWTAFEARKFSNMWLSLPDIIDWRSLAGLSYQSGPAVPASLFQTLEISQLRNAFGSKATLNALKNRRVLAHQLSGSPPLSFSGYDCIYWETTLGKDQYLFHQGDWYKTKRAFSDEVRKSFNHLKIIKMPHVFPQYNHTGEDDYNRAVKAAPNSPYALLDRKLVQYGGGHSSIEICDLFSAPGPGHTKGQLVHVKRGRGSASLSHLFNQGLVSCTLLASAPDFVDQVNSQLKKQGAQSVARKFPSADYDLTYCIIDGPAGRPLDIPFFSKVSLLACVRAVRAYGFEVSLMLVPESAVYLAKQATLANAKVAAKLTKTAATATPKVMAKGTNKSIKTAAGAAINAAANAATKARKKTVSKNAARSI
jgi:uncharacterized protein (TIGR04141 family)